MRIYIIYIIIFCIDDEYLLALNECKNLTAKLNLRAFENSGNFYIISKLYLNYIKAFLETTDKFESSIKNVKNQLDEAKKQFDLHYNEFPILWLERAIKDAIIKVS